MQMKDFVETQSGPIFTHPLLKLLATRLSVGILAKVELVLPPPLTGYQKAKIYVHLFEGEQEIDCKSEEWEDDLNAGLVDLGIRSIAIDVETDRFALALRSAFRKLENRVGDGYFSAVLVQFVAENEFRDHPDISETLKHIPHSPPHRGKNYDMYIEMVRDAIRGRGVELKDKLGYEVSQAVDILAGALGRYLDERFSLTRRRLLGLL